jgi:ATP-grasp domain
MRARPARNEVITPGSTLSNAITELAIPRVLLVITQPWLFPIRAAKAFAAAGSLVFILGPSNHPARRLNAIVRYFSMPAILYGSQLHRCLATVQPHMIVPCDDEAAYRVWKTGLTASPSVKRMIECSLGSSSAYTKISSKLRAMSVAKTLGILMPNTQELIPGEASSKAFEYPQIIKKDVGFGGLGVRIVLSAEDEARVLSEMHVSESGLRNVFRAIKRRSLWPLSYLVDRKSVRYLRQDLISGIAANQAMYCKDGRVVARLSVMVLANASGITSPAALVKIVQHSGMDDTCSRLARGLDLSGFYGVDFILSGASFDAAYFLEINPRLTPICHLTGSEGSSLIKVALAPWQDHLNPAIACANARGSIALFPDGVFGVRGHCGPSEAVLDIPWDEPWLIEQEMRRMTRMRNRSRQKP